MAVSEKCAAGRFSKWLLCFFSAWSTTRLTWADDKSVKKETKPVFWTVVVLQVSLDFFVCDFPKPQKTHSGWLKYWMQARNSEFAQHHRNSPSCSSFAKHASLDVHFLFTAPGFYVPSLGNSLGVICGGKTKAWPAADFRELSGGRCSCKTARPLLQLAEEHEAKRSTFLTEQPPKEEEEKHGMSESRLLFFFPLILKHVSFSQQRPNVTQISVNAIMRSMKMNLCHNISLFDCYAFREWRGGFCL